ncbi:MAG: hypothetical protein IAG13_14690, partial [Deltaproteobacteria bacterium]|nr:hypothetical protein [Nannocystaceae bacterium]
MCDPRACAWRRLWLVLTLAVLSAACGHRRTTVKNIAGATARIRHVEVDGNRALEDGEIEENMNLQQTKWIPPKREWYLPGLLPIDRKRIEELYALHGFYDAKVEPIEAKLSKKGKIVDLHVVVDERTPTLLRKVDFDWPLGLPGGPADRRAAPEKIQDYCKLRADVRFDVTELRACESTMKAALQTRGYALATVVGRAEVDRVEHVAEVRFEMKPGPYVLIGEIT